MPRPRLLSLALVLAAAAGCGRRAPADPSPTATAGAAPARAAAPGAPAHLVAPERVRHAARVVVTGTLRARQSAPLALPVPGTLVQVAVKRGQEVREGAPLASLDDALAVATRRQAESAVAAGRAQLALAEDALARVSRLRQDEGASEAQAVQARAQRDLAAAQLAGAEAQLEQARVNLAHHHLHAPFAGVVTRVPDGLGLSVGAGTPLVTLVGTRELYLETSLTQEDAAGLRPGAKVTVTVPATGARTAEGTVAVVLSAVESSTNRVPVEIAVPNADGRFLPNAFARAELPAAAERDGWRVPSAALVQRASGYAIWVVGPDVKAAALPVRLLAEEGDTALVAPAEGAGWPAALRVVRDPPIGIAEGTLLAEVRG